ncbi:MAG: calcium-binding protein, partial [Pseudomonadota bacterium]
DMLQGRHGDDRLYGGDGQDVLHGGHGRDILHGGGGADRFRFDLSSQDDVISDFEAELDRIEIQHSGLTRADLTIRQDGEDVLIEYAGNTIRVAGTDVSDIDESTLLVA